MQIDRFYMVQNITRGGPASVQHQTDALAKQEARRLAAKHRGDCFVVLECIAAYVTAEPPVVPVDIVTPMQMANPATTD